MLSFLTDLASKFKRRQEQKLWYFKPGDRVTWNEKTGVEPGVSHLTYERELGKVVAVEETSPLPKEILDHYDGSSNSYFAHQYVKIKGRWFSAEWFKPIE